MARGLRVFMLALTVAVSVILLFAYLAKYINPSAAPLLALCGLAAPILYIVEILLMLYWVICWRSWAILPFAVLLLGVGDVSRFYRLRVRQQYSVRRNVPVGAVSILSYNVMGFLSAEDNTLTTVDSIASFVRDGKYDIVCFQEWSRRIDTRQVVDSLFEYKYTAPSQLDRLDGKDLLILSKHPIVDWGYLQCDSVDLKSIWADVRIHNDTLRVVNNHLQSTTIAMSEREYLVNQEYLTDSLREKRLWNIMAKLSQNYKIRAVQADTIRSFIGAHPSRMIVSGDFNDTPVSYVYHHIAGGMQDTFSQMGSGRTNTYRGMFNIFRIDYILHSKDIHTVDYAPVELSYSDHIPISAVVMLDER